MQFSIMCVTSIAMFIEAGAERAVSFTDDTSPDTRNTKKRNVSLHAKVRRENSLDWYYQILYLCRNVKGELKSKDVVEAYKNMPQYRRRVLWTTLKEIQINITDPLPYQVETENRAKKILKKDNAINEIRARAAANDPAAKRLVELLNNQTA